MAVKNSFLAHGALTLLAGKTTPCSVTGSKFKCTECSARFEMSFKDEGRFPMEVGLGFELEDGDEFTKLTFYNDTSEDITIQFYTGNARVTDDRLNTLVQRQIVAGINPPTYIKTSGTTSIAAGASEAKNGTDGSNRRKQIVITNNDEDGDLDVQDENGTIFATVFPKTAWTLETDADLIIENNTLAAIACNIGETFYES